MRTVSTCSNPFTLDTQIPDNLSNHPESKLTKKDKQRNGTEDQRYLVSSYCKMSVGPMLSGRELTYDKTLPDAGSLQGVSWDLGISHLRFGAVSSLESPLLSRDR